MDYLLRDSHFCGVDYGNYDRKWLIHGINYCKKNDKHIIGIHRKAIGVIEHYLMARRLMINSVYKHPKIVASEHLLAFFIQDIFENLEIFVEKNFFKDLPIIRYFNTIKEKEDFGKALDHYLNISDVDIELLLKSVALSDDHRDKSFKIISERIFQRMFPETLEIDRSKCDEVESLLEDYKKNNRDIKSWQLELDHRKTNTYKDNHERIFIIDHHNLKTIDSESFPLLSMANRIEVNPILIIDKDIGQNPSITDLKKNLNEKYCFANSSQLKNGY